LVPINMCMFHGINQLAFNCLILSTQEFYLLLKLDKESFDKSSLVMKPYPTVFMYLRAENTPNRKTLKNRLLFFYLIKNIVYTLLLPFSCYDIFHFSKLKVVSNRLPLFSLPQLFPAIFQPSSRGPLPPLRGPLFRDPIILIRPPTFSVYIKYWPSINKQFSIDSFLDREGLLLGFRYASAPALVSLPLPLVTPTLPDARSTERAISDKYSVWEKFLLNLLG